VGELRDAYLYTVDDLQEVIQENLASRRAAAEEAEQIIDLQTADFMRWLKSLDAVPTILDLRAHIDLMAQRELERARRRLQAGEDAEEVLRWLTYALTQKLAHVPSERLNREHTEELVKATRHLFGLDDEPPQ